MNSVAIDQFVNSVLSKEQKRVEACDRIQSSAAFAGETSDKTG